MQKHCIYDIIIYYKILGIICPRFGDKMKRKLTILLLLLLVATLSLTACNRATPTKIISRWQSDESYTFRISLADFAVDPDTGATKNEFKTTTDGDTVYYKDMSMPGENFTALDEIRPVAVDGLYKLDIKLTSTDQWTVTTEQEIYAQYKKSSLAQNGSTLDLTKCAAWTDLQTRTASETEIAATALTPSDDSIILKSTSKTNAVFYDNTQRPVSSFTEVHGFYIGLANQQLTDYTTEAHYDYSNERKPRVTGKRNDESFEYKLQRNANVIDTNQLLLYIRSINKTTDSFQDTPAVYMFDPLTGQVMSVSFTFSYTNPFIITDLNRADDTTKKVSLNAVAATVNGYAYLLQQNIPDAAKIDTMDAGEKCKYTTVRFRVGYLAYELDTYTPEVWSALKPTYSQD